MIGKTSLVERKRIQWAVEREEMARFSGTWELLKNSVNVRTAADRGRPNAGTVSLAETKDRQATSKPFRAAGRYGSTVSLDSLATKTSGNGTASLECLHCDGGSLMNLHERPEPLPSRIARGSPTLPPICNKDSQRYLSQCQRRDFAVEGSRYQAEKSQRSDDRRENSKNDRYGSQSEEREGETSGYASDSVDVPVSNTGRPPDRETAGTEMIEKAWRNPYYATPESSFPPSSRRLSDGRIGELNRPRWGSVWGQETAREDPPPPSWLSRLGHSSQVLVINHESASSSEGSTVGSIGSDNKSYLRGRNVPVDEAILQERETKRRKALELQNAIKKQLEEKDRRRKEERERRLREERLEEERIEREREKEKERFEEEQRRLKERENAKLRQSEAMREVLEAAERLAKEQKKAGTSRRKRDESHEEIALARNCESNASDGDRNLLRGKSQRNLVRDNDSEDAKTANSEKETSNEKSSGDEKEMAETVEKPERNPNEDDSVRVPVGKDVAIVLSGRLEDSDLLRKANLRLVNLVLTPTPRNFDDDSNRFSVSWNAFAHGSTSPRLPSGERRIPSTIVENRLLTPSKYRVTNGRDFGTQTDLEDDLQDFRGKMRESTVKEVSTKDRKDATNASKRDVENASSNCKLTRRTVEFQNRAQPFFESSSISVTTERGDSYRRRSDEDREIPFSNQTQASFFESTLSSFGPTGETIVRTHPRSKSQPRTRIDSRPQWNANRPGTRYRTQSEKDPHYQRRLRMRRRRIESSDERSRSPSPDGRKLLAMKPKLLTTNKHKIKIDSYDADLSMDSLNSIVQLRTDDNGRINIEDRREPNEIRTDHVDELDNARHSETENSNVWCEREILSKLSTLKNGLLMKHLEWDSERRLISPVASEIY